MQKPLGTVPGHKKARSVSYAAANRIAKSIQISMGGYRNLSRETSSYTCSEDPRRKPDWVDGKRGRFGSWNIILVEI